TRGLGQRLDTAVITEARAVESDRLDTGSLGLFGHALANQTCGSDVAAGVLLACQFLTHFGFQRGSADQHTVAFRRNDACVDVRVGPVYRKAMNAQFGDFPASGNRTRSEEHTSELQSRENLVCRLLLEKKKIRRH